MSTKKAAAEMTNEERITSIIERTSEGIQFPLDLNKTFDTMFSN